MTSFLQLRAIQKSFGPVQVLGGFDLDIAAGSRVAIVGPSGSGKTTLLRIIAGFETPDQGSLIVNGETLTQDGVQAVPAHRRGIGFVPQEGALFPHLTIAGNIGFGLARNAPGRAARIAELMDMVALNRSLLNLRPHELSGGQQQRVALARALALKPRLMLLDEPFSALDTGLRADTRRAVGALLDAAGVTSILVTHDQAEALSFADQIAVMRVGRLAQVGAPREVYQRPLDAATARFLGPAIILPALVRGGVAECALGKLALEDASIEGAFDIMLRPEQIRARAPVDGAAPGACSAVVTAVDFTGNACELSLRLSGSPDAGAMPGMQIQVSVSSLKILPVGARVDISVEGAAHILALR